MSVCVFFFFSLDVQRTVLADEAGWSHFEAELLRCSAKVVEHDVYEWYLFHLWRADLKNSLFVALFQLQRNQNRGKVH